MIRIARKWMKDIFLRWLGGSVIDLLSQTDASFLVSALSLILAGNTENNLV